MPLVKMYQQIRIDAGPEDFNKMTETQKQRLKNQEAMMEVDNENQGRWLIPSSDDPNAVRWQRVMESRDQRGGVQFVRQVTDEMLGPIDEISQEIQGTHPYSDVHRNDYTTVPPITRCHQMVEVGWIRTI